MISGASERGPNHLGGVEPFDTWHANVHQYVIGVQRADLTHGFGAVPCFHLALAFPVSACCFVCESA